MMNRLTGLVHIERNHSGTVSCCSHQGVSRAPFHMKTRRRPEVLQILPK